jgi:retron-type reverse transcriptase
MKRENNLYQKICSLENLQLADQKARKGKSGRYGIVLHDKNRDSNILQLRETLLNNEFKTSEYHIFKINANGKEREIYQLPYFPDRIVHHAILNILEPIWDSLFVKYTYACIKKRGIHSALYDIKAALKNKAKTTYCLKIDIKKYYPSIDHEVLKSLLRRKIKDAQLLKLIDSIIDTAPGLPIGNYLSQHLSNVYLAYFDHYIKENKQVKNYFRYADDMIILSESKQYLHEILSDIKKYFAENLKLTLKSNYQIFPVQSRGIDFCGYVFFHTHILLRKSIKKRFSASVSKLNGPLTYAQQCSISSYNGWAVHCNSRNLLKKINNEIKRRSAA